MAKRRKDGAPPNKRKLTLKEQAFVNAIATPGSPTFGNGTQSAVKVGYASTPTVAARTAWELRRNPQIESAISETFEKYQVGMKVRTETLKELMTTKEVEIVQMDGEGTVTARTRMNNDKVRLATIRELNRMDGTYARAEAIGHAQGKVLEPLVEEWSRRLRAELAHPQEAVEPTSQPAGEPTEQAESVAEPTGEQAAESTHEDNATPETEGEADGVGGRGAGA